MPPNEMPEEVSQPSNVVLIGPESDDTEIYIRRTKREDFFKQCYGVHKKVIVDEDNRLVRCEYCKKTIDPFDYLLKWAQEGDNRMAGLNAIEVKRKVAQAQFDDLTRKIHNLRSRLKRAGEPQSVNDMQHYSMCQENPHLLPKDGSVPAPGQGLFRGL